MAVREMRSTLLEVQKDYEEEKDRTADIVSDMTRQYKAMREELMKKVNSLNEEIAFYKNKLEEEKERVEEMERKKDQEIALKDDKISELTSTMDEMTHEFSQMLKQTLEKMSEKIVITNEWEGGEPKDVKSFENFDMGLTS